MNKTVTTAEKLLRARCVSPACTAPPECRRAHLTAEETQAQSSETICPASGRQEQKSHWASWHVPRAPPPMAEQVPGVRRGDAVARTLPTMVGIRTLSFSLLWAWHRPGTTSQGKAHGRGTSRAQAAGV